MKAFLLIYKGSNASTIINGVKFNATKKSEVVDENRIKDFVHPVSGKSVYADISIHEIFAEGGYKEITSIYEVSIDEEEDPSEDSKEEDPSEDSKEEDPSEDSKEEDPSEDIKEEENPAEDKPVVVYTANELKKLIKNIDENLDLKGKSRTELQDLYDELTK